MALDAAACREALYMASDVAALAILPDSQLTPEEAIETIGGVVQAASADALNGRGEAPCGEVLRRLAALTTDVKERRLNDDQTQELFRFVVSELEAADRSLLVR